MTYLLAFALSTCVIVHTLLYHGRTLLNGFKKIRVENDDIHAKLMRNYPEVPDWWYASAFCVFFSLAIVAVEVSLSFSYSWVAIDWLSGLGHRCTGLGALAFHCPPCDIHPAFRVYLCDDGPRRMRFLLIFQKRGG